MRVTSKGQVTIPIEIREQFGLLPETEVEFVVDGSGVRIVRVESSGGKSRGARLIHRMRGRGDVRMSTDEILALTRND